MLRYVWKFKVLSEMEMSFCGNFHHWLHRKLSEWQLSVQSLMKFSSEWWHLRNFARFVITGNIGCPNDNVWCCQRRQNWHHDNSRLSKYVGWLRFFPRFSPLRSSMFVSQPLCGSCNTFSRCMFTCPESSVLQFFGLLFILFFILF